MSTLFADTSFFVAYLNARDEYHDLALEYMANATDRIVTTEWVLAELGNYLAEGPNRRLFGPLVRALHGEKRMEVVKADTVSFIDAMNLYIRRVAKGWSFTDCTSFCLMKSRKIADALTSDEHFEQAGFTVLLK